jgi:hypothetical protein
LSKAPSEPQPAKTVLSALGYPRKALARAVGLSEKRLRLLLEGHVLPTDGDVTALSLSTGIPPNALFRPERREPVPTFRTRACRSCGTEFDPTGPHHMFCLTCRPRRTP